MAGGVSPPASAWGSAARTPRAREREPLLTTSEALAETDAHRVSFAGDPIGSAALHFRLGLSRPKPLIDTFVGVTYALCMRTTIDINDDL